MKISELNFEQTMEVLANITPYISSIMKDKTLIKSFKEVVNKDNKDNFNKGVERLNQALPILLSSHKEDIIHIVAILNFESYETTKNKNVFEVVSDIKNILDDKDLVSFLRSLV